jgi:hypothetical protein
MGERGLKVVFGFTEFLFQLPSLFKSDFPAFRIVGG